MTAFRYRYLGKETNPRRDRGFLPQSEGNPDEKPLSAPAKHALARSFDPLPLRHPKNLYLKGSTLSLHVWWYRLALF